MRSKISASGIGELLTGGRTADSYILKKAMECVGVEEKFSTKEMEHGIINQYEAFELLLQAEGFEWFDEYVPIDDRCGASPDTLRSDIVLDIKCPYYIDTYLQQCEKLPKKYYQQVQMQMIAVKKDEGGVLFYLTSPEADEWGNKIEYPYSIDDRHRLVTFRKDEEVQYNIMQVVDKYSPILDSWVEGLSMVQEKELDVFFYEQLIQGKKYRKIKTASNIMSAIERAFRVGEEFYYEVN